MKQILIIALALLSSTQIFSQNCNCTATLEWARKVFEENDAGFSTVMNMPGKPQAYRVHNALFEQKVDPISDITQCATTILN